VSFVSTKLGQFRYFDQQLESPVWRGKRVLDFGGNSGNILADPAATIDHDKYWCIDVSHDAIRKGQQTFPEAHWVFYDRYNFEFNPEGIKGLTIPDTCQKFDFILAFSVFTHTNKSEMIELLGRLRRLLVDGGTLAFTFFDPEWNAFDGDPDPGSNLRWRLHKNKVEPTVVDSLLEKAKGANWVTLVNNDELYLDEENEREYSLREQERYIVFCRPEYMKTIFPDADILPPVSLERQHCCVIKAT
jgi:SAM-dependent methyltransferase